MGCARRVLCGAAKLLKAAAGIGRAAPEVIQARRDQCRGCEHAGKSGDPRFIQFKGLTTFSRCALCGCFIAPKTAIASEKCPDGRW